MRQDILDDISQCGQPFIQNISARTYGGSALCARTVTAWLQQKNEQGGKDDSFHEGTQF